MSILYKTMMAYEQYVLDLLALHLENRCYIISYKNPCKGGLNVIIVQQHMLSSKKVYKQKRLTYYNTNLLRNNKALQALYVFYWWSS